MNRFEHEEEVIPGNICTRLLIIGAKGNIYKSSKMYNFDITQSWNYFGRLFQFPSTLNLVERDIMKNVLGFNQQTVER